MPQTEFEGLHVYAFEIVQTVSVLAEAPAAPGEARRRRGDTAENEPSSTWQKWQQFSKLENIFGAENACSQAVKIRRRATPRFGSRLQMLWPCVPAQCGCTCQGPIIRGARENTLDRP